MTTLEDLVWSVQPKRTSEERKKLVAMLPNLLKRLHGGLHAGAGGQPVVDEDHVVDLARRLHAAPRERPQRRRLGRPETPDAQSRAVQPAETPAIAAIALRVRDAATAYRYAIDRGAWIEEHGER